MDAHALLWEHQTAPRRGPRPTLTLTAIAHAGIEIADADGLAAVTMQRVAEHVGVTKMALYRYVPGKDELVALMTDIGIGEPPDLTALPGDWRTRLDAWTRAMFDRFARHPWSLEATVGVRPVGPHEIGWLERAVAALADTGLNGGEMLDVAAVLAGHARAMAVQSAATDAPEQVLTAAFAEVLRADETRFPALRAALVSAAEHDSQDKALDFGLARILDGVEQFVTARGVSRATPGTRR
ncbi:MAG TPA: TetR/AcrR family transcriptional regulator [Pseudonocardiaceae bacterium]|nr:TetR/AcrR family transcriptional regulator [Pseudonocardiaceae bacterium]